MGDYTDALAKDLKRIEGELKKINAVLAKKPDDPAAIKSKKAMMPFLTEASLKKRYEHARKMDAEAMKKQFKQMGL